MKAIISDCYFSCSSVECSGLQITFTGADAAYTVDSLSADSHECDL